MKAPTCVFGFMEFSQDDCWSRPFIIFVTMQAKGLVQMGYFGLHPEKVMERTLLEAEKPIRVSQKVS